MQATLIWCIAKIMPLERACLTELVAHLGHIADADALASERPRHLNPEQTLRLDGLERLSRKAGSAVDCARVIGRDGGYGSGAGG